jgi:DNA-binding NarL/FixJ family response regulator
MPPGQASPDRVRIVIADDDRLFAHMVRARLSAWPNFEVIGIAVDGREAVALTEELEPDLLLLDVSMPGLDGIEAAELIRSGPSSPSIVLITGEDEASDARAYKAGAAAYLRKSEGVVELIDVILTVSQIAVPGG